MKITLDIAKLLEDGRITPEEATRLKGLAAESTGSLAMNMLIGFGVVAVALGVMGLVPQPTVAVVMGGLLGSVGLGFVLRGERAWFILAQICLLAGALMLAGGVMFMTKGSVTALLAVTAIFAGAGVVARSGLLIALAVLALSATIGARTGYMHATYFLAIRQPAMTVLLFSGLAIAAYQASKVLKADHGRLAIVAARTSLLLVNFGFWIGSLWGDRLTWFVDLHDDLPLRAGHPGLDLLGAVDHCHHRCRRLGGARQPALGAQPRRRVRRHPLLHPVVREARRDALHRSGRGGHHARLGRRHLEVQSGQDHPGLMLVLHPPTVSLVGPRLACYPGVLACNR